MLRRCPDVTIPSATASPNDLPPWKRSAGDVRPVELRRDLGWRGSTGRRTASTEASHRRDTAAGAVSLLARVGIPERCYRPPSPGRPTKQGGMRGSRRASDVLSRSRCPAPRELARRSAKAYPLGTGLAVFCRDVTERKTAEEALRESAERLRRRSRRDASAPGPTTSARGAACARGRSRRTSRSSRRAASPSRSGCGRSIPRTGPRSSGASGLPRGGNWRASRWSSESAIPGTAGSGSPRSARWSNGSRSRASRRAWRGSDRHHPPQGCRGAAGAAVAGGGPPREERALRRPRRRAADEGAGSGHLRARDRGARRCSRPGADPPREGPLGRSGPRDPRPGRPRSVS